jgi:hypothetical protein
MSLNKYDAVSNLTEKEYFHILLLFGDDDAKNKAKQAKKMKGLFYSEKYNSLLCGKFEAQNVISRDEFINKIKE